MPDDAAIEIRVPIPPDLDDRLGRLASARNETKAAVTRRAKVRYAAERVIELEITFSTDDAEPAAADEEETLRLEAGAIRSRSEWDAYDLVSLVGVALIFVGFVAAVFPSWRLYGFLVPLGLACMTFAAYGARRRDSQVG